MRESEETLELSQADSSSLFEAALSTVHITGEVIGNGLMLQKCMPIFLEGLGSNQWQAQHVALLLIAGLIPGTKRTVLKDLDQLLALTLPYLQSLKD